MSEVIARATTRLRVGGVLIKPGVLTDEQLAHLDRELSRDELAALVEAGTLHTEHHAAAKSPANQGTSGTSGHENPPGSSGAGGDPTASGNTKSPGQGKTETVAPGNRGYVIADEWMEQLPAQLDRSLVEAFRSLDPNEDEHWIKSGAPDAGALTKAVGRDVSAAERDQLVSDLTQWLGDSGE